MFDTDFFIETYGLKREILARVYGTRDAEPLAQRFLRHLGPRPFVFNVETTSHCNMHCVMCQRTTDFQRRPRHMDMEIFDAIIDQMQPQPAERVGRWRAFADRNLRRGTEPSENNFYFDVVAKTVTLHGFGEPLLDPFLPDRIERMTRKGIPTYFSCNPNNIRMDLMRDLFEAGTGYIKFAMDSLEDARAREIRGPRADFTRAHALVRETLDLKRRMGASTVIVVTLLDFFGAFDEDSEAGRFLALWQGDDVYAYVKSVDNRWLQRRALAEEGGGLRGAARSHYSRQYCEYPWTSMTVLADGSVVACTQDVNGRWTFGNVRESSLREIWTNDPFTEFRLRQITGDLPGDSMCRARCDLNLIRDFLEP